MLALNIASRPLRELFRPLAYAQVAPVPFLLAERLLTELFGVNEWALRALPLIAGLALCGVVVLVARRMLRPDEALVAFVLVAFSSALVRYSAEVKPYSLDALLSVALVGVAADLIRRTDRWKAWALLSGLGAITVLGSLASVFVCLGVGVALAVHAVMEKRWNVLPLVGLMGLGWALLFGGGYVRLYQEETGAPYMRSFWEGSFLVPGTPDLLARTRVAMSEVSWGIYPGMALLGLGGVTFCLVLLGAVTLWRRKEAPNAFLLLVPGLAPFAASAVGVYPIAMRLTLFAAPLFLMLAAVGVVVAGRAAHRFLPRVPMRWVIALLLLPAVTSAFASMLQERDQQMRPLLQSLAERWGPTDPVYIFHRVVPAWLFYTTDWTAPDIAQLNWAMRVSGPGGIGHENGPSRGPRPAGEGRELVYRLKGRNVLLGTSSGVQGRPMFGYLPRDPDPGWAANEGRRMRLSAGPRIWVILGNASHEGTDLGAILLSALAEEGGRLTFRDSLQDGKLYQLEFAPVTPP
jgi:4-amino-4-deoxy-L-arabinose transferase-like glycosyltransferase